MVFIFLLIPLFVFGEFQTLPEEYLDQVMRRKKPLLQECAEKFKIPPKDIFVEVYIESSGKTKARLVNSQQKNEGVLNCSMNILNRTRFQSFSGSPIVKSFYFKF